MRKINARLTTPLVWGMIGSLFAAGLVLTGSGAAPPSEDDTAGQIGPQALARMMGQQQRGGDDLPKLEDVAKDFTKVISTTDGVPPMYTLWVRERDGQILAELPANFENQLLFFGHTITGGFLLAGVQWGDMYAKWKRFDRRLALIEPNFRVRTTGDEESRRGLDRVFTDRVILDVPIVAQGPGGGPVINMTDLLVGQSSRFFGPVTRGANRSLLEIDTAKAFPRNVELAFKMPVAGMPPFIQPGQLVTIHYSISVIPDNPHYKPREADNRVGYFTTTYRDIGDPGKPTPWVRYINRWHLEKADPRLRLSPPKEPIVFYLEHTIPVRYRRWVREGVLEWNKAFEKVGISNAIEVYQQDARTGAHMEKDPADARYNFVVWTNANMGFAIGPSRVDPRTGQILDSDIVMDEGFITSWARAWRHLIPEIAMEGFGPETLAWLESRPQWDPRVRLADPTEREDVLMGLKAQRADRGIHRFAGHPAAQVSQHVMGTHPYDGLAGRVSQVSGMCMNAMSKAFDIALFRLGPELIDEITSLQFEKRTIGEDAISGTWNGAVEVPEMGGEITITMDLARRSDDTVTGTVSAAGALINVRGAFDPGTGSLTLSGDVPEMGQVDFDLTVQGDSMSGTASVAGQRYELSLERTSRPTRTEYAVVEREDRRDGTARDEDDDESADEEADEPEADEEQPEPAEPLDTIDGLPEWFVGPLLREIIMHEIGHGLGLRHNFKASGIYSLEEMNSEEHRGRAHSGSVMDYNPINVNYGDGPVQGDYAVTTIGPYDYWAIEYGYTTESDLSPILARVSEPELAYATDEDTWGPDPMARRFDLGSDPLDYSESQMRLAQHLRGKLLDRVVKDGKSWSKARRGYEILLSRQFSAISIAANWVGGSTVHRDHKGDPGDRRPIENISAQQQRRALDFVIENAFRDDSFGLTSELLHHMTVDKWWDEGGFGEIFQDPTWPVHDRIMGIQAASLTMVMNPTTLRRVYDNEFRIDADEDTVTLPEVILGVADAVWAELDEQPNHSYTARRPKISSLRRNLQTEHLNRLIDLTLPNDRFGIAAKPVSNLSVFQLRELQRKIDDLFEHRQRLDPYTLAHLDEARVRIEKALDAQYIYNTDSFSISLDLPFFFFGHDEKDEKKPHRRDLMPIPH